MMADFFSKLAGRTLEALPLVRPAVNSLYAPDRFRAAESHLIDPDGLSTQKSPEPSPFADAKDATTSVSENIVTNAVTRPAQSDTAFPGTTERKLNRPFRVATSLVNNRPAREDLHASTNHSSHERDVEKSSSNDTTRPFDTARAGDAQALERSAAERESQRLSGERSALVNRDSEDSRDRTSREASRQNDASSPHLLVVMPDHRRVRAAGEDTDARASRLTARTPLPPSAVIAGSRATANVEPDFRQKEEPPAPTIHVSIGRIEVRAVMTPPQAVSRRIPTPQPERSSLEEYLRSRRGGTER